MAFLGSQCAQLFINDVINNRWFYDFAEDPNRESYDHSEACYSNEQFFNKAHDCQIKIQNDEDIG